MWAVVVAAHENQDGAAGQPVARLPLGAASTAADPLARSRSHLIKQDTVLKVHLAWEQAFGSSGEHGSPTDPHSLFDWGL
jgi:hypothetical protein